MMKLLSRLTGENNNNYSYRAIKEGILSLELRPGQSLNVGELAEVLQVSSTPIKNALLKLKQEHLVEIIPQVGSYVSRINPSLVEEAAFMWFNLEKECLKLACNFFSEDSLNQLERSLNIQEMLLEQKKVSLNQNELGRNFNELDEHFHSIIFQSQDKSNVWKVISHMASDYRRVINLIQSEQHIERLIAEHKDILSIIERKEIELVENVLRNHILKPIYGWKQFDKKEFSLSSEVISDFPTMSNQNQGYNNISGHVGILNSN